jgi:hypothetical protein
MMKMRFAALVVMVMAASALTTSAQDIPPPAQKSAPSASSRTPIPVKVTVVVSRFAGEKRLSSMPYVVGVMAGGSAPGPRSRLRMGTDVPVVQTVFGAQPAADFKSIPQTSYTYRNLGTSIDCTASSEQAGDVFHLSLVVSDSSIGLDTGQKKAGTTAIAPDVPTFRTFSSEFTAILKDGQTMQYTSATDPVTGEVTKIDVTLNVMK